MRPIIQLTGDSEFNEVFFDDARTDADLVVGEPGDGWRVAMGTLTFERGVSTLGQQIRFARELSGIVELAERTGAADDPLIRERLTRPWVGLQAMRSYALAHHGRRAAAGQDIVSKLLWANWHRGLGEIAMEVRGEAGLTLDGRRPRRVAAAVPVLPVRHHLRRIQRDPAQHHRRAGARPTPGGQGR